MPERKGRNKRNFLKESLDPDYMSGLEEGEREREREREREIERK